MALITAEIKLFEVARSVTCHLYFPTDLPEAVGNTVKGVITLLHGLGNASAEWMHMSAACRYAADNGFVLVAPSADNSFYVDMQYGPPWYTMLTELLPVQLARIFKLPTAREQNFIAGLSMGGYGALRTAFLHPERYAAAGSFSGALDMNMMATGAPALPDICSIFVPVLGEGLRVDADRDLFALARRAAALPKAEQPRIFCTCGAQDEDTARIHTQNRNFCRVAEALPLDFTYREWDGVHEWNFWDRSLAEFIGFIKNDDYAQRKRRDWGAEG